MKYSFILTMLLFSLAITTHSYAQQNKTVSLELNDARFDQFVQAIEKQTGYHFYYDTKRMDSASITIHVQAKPLADVLKAVFANTRFQYAISGESVFVTSQYTIQTSLTPGFFGKQTLPDTDEPERAAGSAAANRHNAKTVSAEENKLYEIGQRDDRKGGTATVAGYIRDGKNGEPVIGATIYNDATKVGVATDQYGYFSMTLPRGRHTLQINSVGMNSTKRQIALYNDGKLNIEMFEYVPSLKTVVVSTEKAANIRSANMGMQKLNIKTMKQVPALLGEVDVLRVVMALPGVTSVGESSTGLNVRGGSADQNLILFSDATVYNPSHFFGFFSAFNPDAVKDVELYKSSIPERFGGRLSSVLDISTREGNKKKLAGSGGIGPLTGRLTLEGPIDSGRTSFIIGGRTTYANWLLKNIPNKEYSNSKASFYDIDGHISHQINAKNNLYFNGYYSSDHFQLNGDTSYQYSNQNVNVKWKHIFNNKLYGTVVGGLDRYQYKIGSNANEVNAYKFGFDINQTFLKLDVNYSPNNKHLIKAGFSTIYYKLNPGTRQADGDKSQVVYKKVQAEQGLESALYVGDQYTITPDLVINGGVRFSMFNSMGPKTVYDYIPGQPRETYTIIDTTNYAGGKIMKTYMAPEFRFSARYSLSSSASVKIGYNSLRQYIHMLSNTTAISPTDIWKLSDINIKPQSGDQFSLGFYKNFHYNTIETSVEVYYKRIKNFLDYKSGASLVLNDHIETDVVNAKGKAYGVEVMLKKTAGKLNGWISYAYSRTLLKTDDPLVREPVNHGDYYPADFDKPHSVNFIGNYKFSHRFSVSLNILYSTGRPITLPVAEYYLNGSYRAYYSDRNQFRIPDYFRTDFSVNIEGNHKVKKLAHSSWTAGLFNVTGRRNPYSVYFTSENGAIKGYKLSIFGTIIPFITYNFKF